MKLTDTCDYPDLPGDSDGKAPVYNAGALGSIPGSGETPEKGKVTPPRGSGLERHTHCTAHTARYATHIFLSLSVCFPLTLLTVSFSMRNFSFCLVGFITLFSYCLWILSHR